MPVIKSAIKKLRHDRKREKENDQFRSDLERALKLAKKQKTQASVIKAVSLLDKGVKKNLVHKNRAGRIKSGLSKLAKPAKKTASKPATPKKKTTTSKSKTKKVSA